MPLEVAATPLLMRSVIDDSGHLKRFTRHLIDVATAVKGARFVATNDEKLTLCAAALFYGAFAIGGLRTLGEEHVGLMPITFNERMRAFYRHFLTGGGRIKAVDSNAVPDSVGATPLTMIRRLLLAVLLIFEGFVLRRIAGRLFPNYDRQTVTARFNTIHLMLFYLFGTYATLPHRLAGGVRYLALSPHLQTEWKDKNGPTLRNPYFKLGLMLAFEHIYLLIQVLKGWKRREIRRMDEQEKALLKQKEKEKAKRRRKRQRALEKARRPPKREGELSSSSSSSDSENDAEKKNSDDDDDATADPTRPTVGNCMLCLCKRKNPTATVCGHIFCWQCVTEWLKTAKVCPLCRYQCAPSQLIPLANYGVLPAAE